MKDVLVRVMFQIMTRGRGRIFYVRDGNRIVHTSYVMTKCYKFDFLGESDYEIDPCVTYPEYRGHGIYPDVLKHVCNCLGTPGATFYMSVNEKNAPSIRGIEKAGVMRCGTVSVTRFTKKYRIEQ